MRKQACQERGFSLVELVLVMFITGLVLFMVAKLTSRTLDSLRFLQEKSQTLQSATLGLERLSSELREAIEIVSLNGPLTFRKVDPGAPIALANDLAEADPANNWKRTYNSDYLGANRIGTVTYQTDVLAQTIQRTASINGASLTSQVATSVNDFNIIRAPNLSGTATGQNVFEISLSLQEQRKVVNFKTVVLVPGIPQ